MDENKNNEDNTEERKTDMEQIEELGSVTTDNSDGISTVL